ncbi:MAG: CRTAC1 family protein [Candidatus Pacebacteria bacterium]|nr:CRTAC1 family protein [Candidatus Paceibacterota bacterium]
MWPLKVKNAVILLFLTVVGLLILSGAIISRGKTTPIAFTNVAEKMDIGNGRINGIAWVDYDNDGDLDLFSARLYRNDGGSFTDVTVESGLDPEDYGQGIAAADINNDGCLDVYVTRSFKNDRLWKNNCDGTFTDVALESGIENYSEPTGVAWSDYNNDGFIDIYVANNSGLADPANYTADLYVPNRLFRNNKDGTFTEVAQTSGVTGLTTCYPKELRKKGDFGQLLKDNFKVAFQPIWVDYNDDSLPDLFVATDTFVSPLYKNNGDGTFTDVTEESGLCRLNTGMGVTVSDVDNDGDMDIYVANSSENYLWINEGGFFTESAKKAGIAEIGVGWGLNFFDYDNDGDEDLYVANGRLMAGDQYTDNKGSDLDVLYENLGGLFFKEVSSEVMQIANYPSTGSAVGDYNNDGFVDLFVTHFIKNSEEAKHNLWKNSGNDNNWITIIVEGTTTNRAAIGAKVVLMTKDGKTQTRVVRSGESFNSQNSLWLTFGLGKNRGIKILTIYWPSGVTQIIENPKINEILRVLERQQSTKSAL